MSRPPKSPSSVLFLLAGFVLATGLTVACEKEETNSPDENKKSGNMCEDYKSCNECIAGQQAKGETAGAAETQCGAAATGCWTTWEKPVKCGEKEVKEKE